MKYLLAFFLVIFGLVELPFRIFVAFVTGAVWDDPKSTIPFLWVWAHDMTVDYIPLR